jgi:hypothetical protein
MERSYYGNMDEVPKKDRKLADDSIRASINMIIEKELKHFHEDLKAILYEVKEGSEKLCRKVMAEVKALNNKVYLLEAKIKPLLKKENLTKQEIEEQKEKEEVRRRLRARGVNVV